MPVPISARPVRARIVPSLRSSSHEASLLGSSSFCSEGRGPSAAAKRLLGTAGETKRAPPAFIKLRRVIAVTISATQLDSPGIANFGGILSSQAAITLAARWTAAMIAVYVPQRQKWGEGGVLVNASFISATVGCGFLANNCTAAIIIPLWQ